jgi:hypothetical protein
MRFAVLSLAKRLKGDNDIGCVVAIDNATRIVPNQPPHLSLGLKISDNPC